MLVGSWSLRAFLIALLDLTAPSAAALRSAPILYIISQSYNGSCSLFSLCYSWPQHATQNGKRDLLGFRTRHSPADHLFFLFFFFFPFYSRYIHIYLYINLLLLCVSIWGRSLQLDWFLFLSEREKQNKYFYFTKSVCVRKSIPSSWITRHLVPGIYFFFHDTAAQVYFHLKREPTKQKKGIL